MILYQCIYITLFNPVSSFCMQHPYMSWKYERTVSGTPPIRDGVSCFICRYIVVLSIGEKKILFDEQEYLYVYHAQWYLCTPSRHPST